MNKNIQLRGYYFTPRLYGISQKLIFWTSVSLPSISSKSVYKSGREKQIRKKVYKKKQSACRSNEIIQATAVHKIPRKIKRQKVINNKNLKSNPPLKELLSLQFFDMNILILWILSSVYKLFNPYGYEAWNIHRPNITFVMQIKDGCHTVALTA